MEGTTPISFDPVKCEAEYKKYRQHHALGSKQLTGQTPVHWTFEGLCRSFYGFVKQVGSCMHYAFLGVLVPHAETQNALSTLACSTFASHVNAKYIN